MLGGLTMHHPVAKFI